MPLPLLTLVFGLLPQAAITNVVPADASRLFNACKAYVRIVERSSTEDEDWNNGNFCAGFIQGFASGDRLLRESICPGHVTLAAIAQTYVRAITATPDLLSQPRETGFAAALATAYPCQLARN